MIVKKNLSLAAIYEFAGHHLIWLIPWMSLITTLYYFTHWQFITIPWLPLSLVGTAVAFYVGFKNNQSYDRVWEARKIWGGFVNNSRKLATMIKNYHSDNADASFGEDIRKKIVYRHIAYLYQFREQMLQPTQWEHVSLSGLIGYFNRKRREKNFSSFREELEEISRNQYLAAEEITMLKDVSNKATQILDLQTRDLQLLYKNKAVNSIQQVKIQDVLNSFYDDQGRAERIKRTPFPRKYGSFSYVFVCIFVFLLPFGIVGEFSKLGDSMVWLSIPFGVIVGWVYVVMEMIGDYSENPFEGLHNDIPMLSICRTIEIDMLQMIGEKNIPKTIQPKQNNLL